MSTDPRLDELLLRYEELCVGGSSVSPAELCRDCPELLDDFKQRLASLTSINQLLQKTSDVEETPTERRAAIGLNAIPGFEVLEEIGRGGMGVVYKARHLGLNRLVALKIILAGSHAGVHERARFQTEAGAIARIQHPHIVQIHDIGTHADNAYLVLEFVDGGNLDGKLTGAPWAVRSAAELVQQLACAVHAAHERGVVHRDLKPANILLAVKSDQRSASSQETGTASDHSSRFTDHWIPKIADFGLAKCLDSDSAHTRSGAVLGTPCYMAPEQAAGHSRAVGPRTDVYALGVILYQLLTGQVPFKGESVLDTLEKVRTQDALPPRQLQPKVPRDLETICLQALNKQPERRYDSAQALADDLGRFLRGEPILARRSHLLARAWRWLQRSERMRDAGTFMLVHALLRTFSATLELRRLPALAEAGLLGPESPWLWWLIWNVGICIVLCWIGWRTLQQNIVALWAGLLVTAIYLIGRVSFLPALLRAEADTQPGGFLLLWFLFMVQFVLCAAALVAYYAQAERAAHARVADGPSK